MSKLKNTTQNSKLRIIFLGTPDFVQQIKENLKKNFILVDSFEKADLAVVASYGKILTKEELNLPKFGAINVHPSLLPKYRGPSPIQSAILNGDRETGITIIKMDEEIDHGPIIYQDSLELSNKDNFDTLSKKLFQHSAEILPKVIKDYTTGKITLKEQNHKEAIYCEKLTRESGYFSIDNPPDPQILDKMIRAYYPWPGVWTKWKGKIVKFLPSPRHSAREAASSLVSESQRSRNEFGMTNFLIQMEGKKAISYKDFLNGYPDFPLK